ncbi:hypothetical protein [Microbacterium sp. RD06]|uniref:hypothetical protein n=1 Tax=Microbacterium sp. RD06 TaxID=3035796 RepID=UPI0024695E7B|nr:hypothetical protein [Microbacterium sp. RD06]
MTAQVRAVQPAVEIDELPDVWEPGQDLMLRVSAQLGDEFWEESGIPQDEPVTLVGTITCLAARTKWRAAANFVRVHDVWAADVDIEVDGSAVAVEALVDVAVIGPGRTGHPDPARAVHRSARLWRLPRAIKVPFERLGDDFPTSAVSFVETGRRRIPWRVDVAHDAEPSWGLTSAMRLYVNTDLPVAARILDGTAERWVYQSIQTDIYTASLFQLAAIRDGYSTSISESAESDMSSFGAFCVHVSATLGFDLEVALRLASEDPMQLIERAREASEFMREEG